jgi:hypothetical protein
MYSYCNICNIPIYFCNSHIKYLRYISEILETYACNMRFQRNISLLLGRMEARCLAGGAELAALVEKVAAGPAEKATCGSLWWRRRAGGAVEREEGGRPWRAGGAMEREEDGRPRSAMVEMPAGERPDAMENTDGVANHDRNAAVSFLFLFLKNCSDWRGADI